MSPSAISRYEDAGLNASAPPQQRLLDGWLLRFSPGKAKRARCVNALAASVTDVVALQPVDGEHFAQAVGALRGSPLAQRDAQAVRLRNAPVNHRGFVVQRDGETLACGQYAIESDIVGLYDVFTAARERGRGIARELCHAMLVRARGEGARSAYLQVDAGNDAARAVYHRLGFADAYAYHYRARDPRTA